MLTNNEIKQQAINLLGRFGENLKPDEFQSKNYWRSHGFKIKEGEKPFFKLEQLIPVKYIYLKNELIGESLNKDEEKEGFKSVKVDLYHKSQVERSQVER